MFTYSQMQLAKLSVLTFKSITGFIMIINIKALDLF